MKYTQTRKERQKEKKRKAYEDQASTYQGNMSWGRSSSLRPEHGDKVSGDE